MINISTADPARYDRDMYVDVIWENINSNQSHNFYKYPRTYAFPLFDYDFTSLMHFDLRMFGAEGRRSLDLTVYQIQYLYRRN